MKKILSIDGGGIKGLIPAIVCGEIERRAGRPLRDQFDMLAGTSTGAIVASALAKGIAASEVENLYRQQGPRIFRRPRPFLLRLRKAKYRGSQLLEVLSEYLGDDLLGSVALPLMITAYDVTGTWDENGNPGPVFFKSWRDSLQQLPLADAVQASSAAPSYFPPHRVSVPWKDGAEACLYDGGLYAGDPALCAYAEARRLWPEEEILVVSIGTGVRERGTSCARAEGLVNLAQRVHAWMLDGSTDTVPYIADRILRRYIRLDAHMDRHVAMDDASEGALQILTATAQELVRMHAEAIDRIANLSDTDDAVDPPV